MRMIRSKTVILASASPFRRQMLHSAGIACDAITSDIDEEAEKSRLLAQNPPIDPERIALELAGLKAKAVSCRHPDITVLGADQVMTCDGGLFSKPRSREHAEQQLKAIRGRGHSLPTAAVLAVNGRVEWQFIAEPRLKVRDFSNDFLTSYLDRMGEVVTRTVGGYQLEGLGAQLFEQVEGDYFSIIGLPLFPLLAELRRRGIAAA